MTLRNFSSLVCKLLICSLSKSLLSVSDALIAKKMKIGKRRLARIIFNFTTVCGVKDN